MAKSWKPPLVESDFDSSERGLANVLVGTQNGKKVAKIKFVETENEYLLRGKAVPENLSKGLWNITLSDKNTEVFGFFPANGNFKFKVKSFAKGSGEDDTHPAPVENKKYPGQYSFTVLLEILEPENFAGLTVPFFLPYRFKMKEWEGHEVVGFPSRDGKTIGRTKLLAEFLDMVGAWDQGPMKYKDNLLIDLQKRILRAKKPFNGIIKDGWMNTVFATFEATEDLDWSEDENEPIVSEEEADAALERIDEVGFEVDEELPWQEEE